MAQTNLIGKNILGYTVSEKLGSGAFGTVYKVIKTYADTAVWKAEIPRLLSLDHTHKN